MKLPVEYNPIWDGAELTRLTENPDDAEAKAAATTYSATST